MTAWRVLNTLDLSGAPEAVAALEGVGRLDSLTADRSHVLEALDGCHAYLASAVARIDEEFLDSAQCLRLIGSPHTGVDHMDLDEIEKRGITLFTITRETELLNSFSATSELAFGLLLSLVRNIPEACESANKGDWARERFSGFQLLGKTLGILGLGRLGKISARIGRGFGMNVIAHDIADVSAEGVEMVDMDTLLAKSDVLTVHVHLNEQTRGLLGRKAFAAMKTGAILLNTSRGAIIDEDALLGVLQSGRLRGVALDMVEGEWCDDLAAHPLIVYARENPNLVITPHIGGSTRESINGARVFMARKMADHIRSWTD